MIEGELSHNGKLSDKYRPEEMLNVRVSACLRARQQAEIFYLDHPYAGLYTGVLLAACIHAPTNTAATGIAAAAKIP